MLRVKSFVILTIPTIITLLNVTTQGNLAPEPVIEFVNGFFVVLFGIMQAWAWLRTLKTK